MSMTVVAPREGFSIGGKILDDTGSTTMCTLCLSQRYRTLLIFPY